ncbi:DUF803-domain-containing protein [Rhizoclosmatium globosum]|uniref:DUF803-domain-containing protein n=1 Tax=Rhizoclosmatium globosum TaxID=329046 RepID=A0A1Y2D3Q3_9FUNG|nr:DUF803-domain-containing protein [Rhizoclosmatium globosum]|eukprot:ORY53913.1 DUF803-domain-containing protein [Rhizoclosmatium globosum]
MSTPHDAEPTWYKYVGITLALTSGLFIGSSFIFKKRGLLDTKAKHGELGDGHAYLKSPMWWTGMILMALGEVLNFVAYAFSPAILVTPLGAISVVISAILSEIFLKERLNFTGKVGCAQCIIGAIIIVLHAPESNGSDTIPEFFGYVMAPSFIMYAVLCGAGIAYLVYIIAPLHGETNPMVYITTCSLIGSFLVLSCQGLGSSLAYTFSHWNEDNQFLQWPIYPLIAFIALTVTAQIHFLNKALNTFSTAIVTPVYYVTFTTCTLISSAVLFRGFTVNDTVEGITLIMGFLAIVAGVALLFDYNDKMARRLLRLQARAEGDSEGAGLVMGSIGQSELDLDSMDSRFSMTKKADKAVVAPPLIKKSAGVEVVLEMENVDRSRTPSAAPLNPSSS